MGLRIGAAAVVAVIGLAASAAISRASAANTPCSGKKGGVSHCLGAYFVCNDGTTSQSKRTCSAAGGEEGDAGGSAGRARKGKR